ncbi:hypothetical protein BY996DRAFT_6494088 [Phakopsora pachyrhizi]|nr:hypothetical protein BY996DRAFT_6494088 [Phakopsora pachyrhizi]
MVLGDSTTPTSYIPPLMTLELSRVLINRLFRLVRCHLALLNPHSAIQPTHIKNHLSISIVLPPLSRRAAMITNCTRRWTY